ncbi:MAG: DUF3598 family protein [Moorea sp. SIO2B7]|nr:DUF3598 family protein [Moorena sp. SIO2B7]
MNFQEQNWQNFCANHLRDWHGIWTRYTPQGEVIESFQSLRSLRVNQDKTVIYQTNRYTYHDGRIEEKNWQSKKESKNANDGLIHPKTSVMRSLYFEQGGGIWVTKQLEPGNNFHGGELFFRYENLRHSIGSVYDENGNLKIIGNVREDSKEFPSQYWSSKVNLLPEKNLSKNWQGTAFTMTSELEILPPTSTKFYLDYKDNKIFFLPDGISFSCPEKVVLGIPFIIIANWLVNPSHLQQMVVSYNEKGRFSQVQLKLLEL